MNKNRTRSNFTIMKIAKFIVIILIASLLSSCMTTRTNVNRYKETSGQTYRYAKGKQLYLFWGLIPLGRATVATPTEVPCQIRTSHSFFDLLCTSITGGILSMQTIKVMAKHSADSQNSFKIGDVVTYKQKGNYLNGTIDSIIDNEKCVVKTEDGDLVNMKFENLSK